MTHPKIEIVESHNEVLPYWAALRVELEHAPRLFTLDHHTDTSPPFRDFLKRQNLSAKEFEKQQAELLSQIDYKNNTSVQRAIETLKNDEHIIAALQTDILSSACVLAHNAMTTDLECYQTHRVICKEVVDPDTVIESHVLNKAFEHFHSIYDQAGEKEFFSEPYILDIDLDVFNTFQSVQPECTKFLKEIAAGAELITIATEPEYVQSCAMEEGLESSFLLGKVKSLIENFEQS